MPRARHSMCAAGTLMPSASYAGIDIARRADNAKLRTAYADPTPSAAWPRRGVASVLPELREGQEEALVAG